MRMNKRFKAAMILAKLANYKNHTTMANMSSDLNEQFSNSMLCGSSYTLGYLCNGYGVVHLLPTPWRMHLNLGYPELDVWEARKEELKHTLHEGISQQKHRACTKRSLQQIRCITTVIC
jgi:hypothetical protein